MRARASLGPFEDLFGPAAIGLDAQRQVAVKGLQELGILPPHIGDDLVGVGRHEARRMHQDPMELRRVGEAIPSR